MESNSVFFVLRMNRTNKCKSIYLIWFIVLLRQIAKDNNNNEKKNEYNYENDTNYNDNFDDNNLCDNDNDYRDLFGSYNFTA